MLARRSRLWTGLALVAALLVLIGLSIPREEGPTAPAGSIAQILDLIGDEPSTDILAAPNLPTGSPPTEPIRHSTRSGSPGRLHADELLRPPIA